MKHSNSTTLAPFVEKLEARSRFSNEEREALLGLPFVPSQIRTNLDFVRRGEPVNHSCFVLDGLVGTFGENRNGGRQITSVFMQGDIIDLQSVVLPEAMSALQALTTTTILRVPHSALRQTARLYPNIAESFWRECVVDASIVNEWVVNVGRRRARPRMAHLFCEIACRSNRYQPDKPVSFPFPVTQNHLGDMLGLTPVHVNRTIREFRDEQVLETQERTVRILNWDRLAQIGEFDATYLRLGLADSIGELDAQQPCHAVN